MCRHDSDGVFNRGVWEGRRANLKQIIERVIEET